MNNNHNLMNLLNFRDLKFRGLSDSTKEGMLQSQGKTRHGRTGGSDLTERTRLD